MIKFEAGSGFCTPPGRNVCSFCTGDPDCFCGSKRTRIKQNFVLIEDILGQSVDDQKRPIRELKFNTCPMSQSDATFSGSKRSSRSTKSYGGNYFRNIDDLTCAVNNRRTWAKEPTCSIATTTTSNVSILIKLSLFAITKFIDI